MTDLAAMLHNRKIAEARLVSLEEEKGVQLMYKICKHQTEEVIGKSGLLRVVYTMVRIRKFCQNTLNVLWLLWQTCDVI